MIKFVGLILYFVWRERKLFSADWKFSHVDDLFAVSNIVADSPYKIFIGGLPSYLNAEQVCFLIICMLF